jgi:hypothetical protein
MGQTIDFTQLPLRDIHLPGLIAWWPPAAGWWIVAAAVLAGLVAIGLYYRRGRHRRAALRSVRKVHAALEQGAEPVACLQRVSTTLRRFAMTTADAQSVASLRAVDGVAERASSDEVAGMIGDRWLRYLDGRWQRDEFSRGLGRLLVAAPYTRPGGVDRHHALDLTALCAEWLKAQSAHSPRRARVERRGGVRRFARLFAGTAGGT